MDIKAGLNFLSLIISLILLRIKQIKYKIYSITHKGHTIKK